MTDETTNEVESYDGESEQSFEDFLASIFGGSREAAPGVEDRFDALADTVNERLRTLDDQNETGESREYGLTLNTDEIRWVLSAIGWFVDSEVRDNGPVSHTLLNAAEKVLDVTAPVAA